MNSTTVNFTFERETKGAVRYQEVVPSGDPERRVIGTLYLRKTALNGTVPQRLTVTIKEGK
mgnify:CR=1 FL=1